MRTLQDLSLLKKLGWQNFLKYRSSSLQGFSVGIPELDKLIGGLSGIVGIQGEPGSCKSTFALQIAVHNASKGVPVMIVDRENGENRFRQRILSQVNLVPRHEIMKCSEDQLRAYCKNLKDLNLYVETSYKVDLEMISEYLKLIYQTHACPMLLVVDSLQALPKIKEDERLALQHWLEGLDQLKLDFEGNLVILMTSEKSRGRYEVASKEGGKGTGSIEFKCEQLIDMRGLAGGRVIAAKLVKNRDGICTEDFYLSKQLSDHDPSNFVFKLRPAGQADVDEMLEEEKHKQHLF